MMFRRYMHDNERGYSITELAAVLGLVGLLWAAGAPRIPRLLSSYDLASTASQVAAELRLARMRAITTNVRARLQFASGSYTVQRESPRDSNTYVADRAPAPVSANVTITVAPAAPTFDSRGLVATPTTITLRSTAGVTKTITVSALGRVTVS